MIKNDALVSVIIVNMGDRDMLSACLQSVVKQSYHTYEIILVDKGPDDGSIRNIQKRFPKATIVRQATDLGYQQAVNKGLQYAKGTLLFLLNDDAVIEKDVLANLVLPFRENKNLFVCQARIMKYGTNLLESEGYLFTWTGFFYYPNRFTPYKEDKQSKPKEIFGAVFAAVLIDRKKYEELGGLDEDFFVSYDDADICWRAQSRGYSIFYVSSAVVYHIRSATVKKMKSRIVVFHTYKNRIMTILKNLESPYIFWVLPVHLFFVFAACIVYTLFFKPGSSFMILRAVIWNITHFRQINAKRKLIQEKRIVWDKILIGSFSSRILLPYLLKFGLESII